MAPPAAEAGLEGAHTDLLLDPQGYDSSTAQQHTAQAGLLLALCTTPPAHLRRSNLAFDPRRFNPHRLKLAQYPSHGRNSAHPSLTCEDPKVLTRGALAPMLSNSPGAHCRPAAMHRQGSSEVRAGNGCNIALWGSRCSSSPAAHCRPAAFGSRSALRANQHQLLGCR